MAIFLVDYENTGVNGLSGIETLAPGDRVFVFYGDNAGSIPFDRHICMTSSRAVIRYLHVLRSGKNYLDFQIATYVGYLIASGTDSEINIVSNDGGFDAVIDFWRVQNPSVSMTRRPTLSPPDLHSQDCEKKQSGKKKRTKTPSMSSDTPKAESAEASNETAEVSGDIARGADGEMSSRKRSRTRRSQKTRQDATAEAPQAENEALAESAPEEVAVLTAEEDEKPKKKREKRRLSADEGDAPDLATRERLREKVRGENLAGGSYASLYSIFARVKNKQDLNIALVKAFRQEQGNRLYKLIVSEFEHYIKANHA